MKITLIGSGKLATQLGLRLVERKHEIIQVYSRTLENAQKLAKKLNAEATNELSNITTPADVCIVAVKDDVIQKLSKKVTLNTLIVHTSGSVSTEVLNNHKNYGSFYPLQSFSQHKTPDWNNLPILVYANNESCLNRLQRLAKSISNNFQIINNEQRQQLHLAAVFANNFSNHLFTIAENILAEKNISLDLLKPLIIESVQKINIASPKDIQTGPAIRNDIKTIEKHLQQLENKEDLKQLYELFTKLISSTSTK